MSHHSIKTTLFKKLPPAETPAEEETSGRFYTLPRKGTAFGGMPAPTMGAPEPVEGGSGSTG